MQHIRSTIPHPRGRVTFTMRPLDDGRAQLTGALPGQTPGQVFWGEEVWELDAGATRSVQVMRGA